MGGAGSFLSLLRAVSPAASSQWFQPTLVSAALWSQFPLDSTQVATALLGPSLAPVPVSGSSLLQLSRFVISIACSHAE